MTKQDFELIARVLREARRDYNGGEDITPDVIAQRFADELVVTNHRFDRKRFIAACAGLDATDSVGRRVRYSNA